MYWMDWPLLVIWTFWMLGLTVVRVTAAQPVRSPGGALVHLPAVVIRGDRWLVCPIGGAECCRVGATSDWAADVIAVHVRVSHRWVRLL